MLKPRCYTSNQCLKGSICKNNVKTYNVRALDLVLVARAVSSCDHRANYVDVRQGWQIFKCVPFGVDNQVQLSVGKAGAECYYWLEPAIFFANNFDLIKTNLIKINQTHMSRFPTAARFHGVSDLIKAMPSPKNLKLTILQILNNTLNLMDAFRKQDLIRRVFYIFGPV